MMHEALGIGPEHPVLACELRDLLAVHNELAEKPAMGAPRHYAVDVPAYLKASVNAVNRQALVQAIVDKCGGDSRAVPIAYDMVMDREFMAELHAMACADAREQALVALYNVCNEQLPAGLRASPTAGDNYIRLRADGRFIMDMKVHFRDAERFIAEAERPDNEIVFEKLGRMGKVLVAVERAFRAAAVVLLSYDIEESMASLMAPEVEAALGH